VDALRGDVCSLPEARGEVQLRIAHVRRAGLVGVPSQPERKEPRVGTISVTQVMPATGKELNVGNVRIVEPNIHDGMIGWP
jgi:hypothetical protein